MTWLLKYLSTCTILLTILAPGIARADSDSQEPSWDQDAANQPSLRLEPVRETAVNAEGLHLALKHYANPGAQPVLMIHGLAQNDRSYDSAIARWSFARYLHAQGFDVWVGNLRGAGTEGFRSDTPWPHHWSVEDYAATDIPALVNYVRAQTSQAPFLVGHSMAAWAFEGYLGGASLDHHGIMRARTTLSGAHQSDVKGVITIAGMYNVWWQKKLAQVTSDPIRSAEDFYHSDYELELLAQMHPLYHIIPMLPALPLGWIGQALYLPMKKIPWVGEKLANLYADLQFDIIETPILSMFIYSPNENVEAARVHIRDGLEDLGPHLLEQLANAINTHELTSYYHLDEPSDVYHYGQVRDQGVKVPLLFVAGDKDRCANAEMIYEDGYLATKAADKQF
ncbi:MAG: alpha/beta hydrolase, partial [Bdellovibrionota bacterium]